MAKKVNITKEQMLIAAIACNVRLFEGWMGQFLIKELKLEEVAVMDNAGLHKPLKIRFNRIYWLD